MSQCISLVAATLLLAGCSTNVNVAPLSVPPDAVQPREAERVEVFDQASQPTRPYMTYALITATDATAPKEVLKELREKGGAAGCDGIVLRAEPREADCIIYRRD